MNLGDTAHGHGDGMAFEAVLRDTTGNAVGELLGWVITVDVVDGDSAKPVYLTEHIGTMIIKFDEENNNVNFDLVGKMRFRVVAFQNMHMDPNNLNVKIF